MKFNSHIPNFADSDFISFLYSERERENNLNQYQGWNYWVLIVALISTLCALYSTCRSITDIFTGAVFYFISGLISGGFAYKTILDVFRKDRACDFTRVRFLKDVVPWVDIAFIMVASIILSVWSYWLFGEITSIFLVWGAIFICYVGILLFDIVFRKELTPVNLNKAYFPKLYQNIILNGYFGAFWGVLSQHSFQMADKALLSVEFEIAIYATTIFFLLYFIFTINFGNKVVKEFDLILDRYLYQGESKENTFNMILMNRMGYGVLEVCYNEWKQILTMLSQVEDVKEMILKIRKAIVENNYDLPALSSYWNILRVSIQKMEKILRETQKLSGRLDEFVKVSDAFDREDVEKLFNTNEIAYSNVDDICNKVSELKTLIQAEVDKYYCNRVGVLCKNECQRRTDNRVWIDVLRYRLNYLSHMNCKR